MAETQFGSAGGGGGSTSRRSRAAKPLSDDRESQAEPSLLPASAGGLARLSPGLSFFRWPARSSFRGSAAAPPPPDGRCWVTLAMSTARMGGGRLVSCTWWFPQTRHSVRAGFGWCTHGNPGG